MLFDTTKLYKHHSLFAVFLARTRPLAQSSHENNMSGASIRSVLARICDNSWENERDFVKKKLSAGARGAGGERERALVDAFGI